MSWTFFYLAEKKQFFCIYQIMKILVSSYTSVINWLEMYAHAKVINVNMMGKKKWSCREFWLTKKQDENMAMNSLTEPMRKSSLCHDKRSHRGTWCLPAQRNLATGRRWKSRTNVYEGSKINLIQKATENFPLEETFVLRYHRTSRNTTEGVIAVSASWRPVTGADLIIKEDPPPTGRLWWTKF